MAPRELADRHLRVRSLRRCVEHVSGPEEVDYGPDEVLAICVVRNGAAHIRSFLDHHFALGVSHIVVLDNGSTDETPMLAARYSAVTVLRAEVPYARYENAMKLYLAQRFSRGRWNLCVDVDERFVYPNSNELPLSAFLSYLNEHGYNAVLAQMLDMFGEIAMMPDSDGSPLEDQAFYDLSDISTTPYRWGAVPDDRIRMHWGGIRKALFGTENGLTKAALVRLDARVRPFIDWHHARNARLADVTALLLHYPFGEAFAEKVRDAVETGRYGHLTTREYRNYWAHLRDYPDLALPTASAQRLTSVDELVDQGFLVVSDAYHRWVVANTSESRRPR